MYRPQKLVAPVAPVSDDGNRASRAPPVDSIYSRPRSIQSLGLTLGLNSSANVGSRGRLRLGLLHDEEDEDYAAAELPARTASRLTRDKPWRAANSTMAHALQQAQQPRAASATLSAAQRRPATATGPQASRVPPPRSTTPANRPTPTNDATATNDSRQQTVRPQTAFSRPRMDALAASIETLRSSTFQTTAKIARRALESQQERQARPTVRSQFESPSSQGIRSSPSHFAHPAVARPVPTQTAGYALPTAASGHHHARPARTDTSSSTRTNQYHSSGQEHASRRSVSSGSSAASGPPPSLSAPPPVALPPCVVRSFLRITPPNARARALLQHRELGVLHHDARTVQFIDDTTASDDGGKPRRYQRHQPPPPPEPSLFQFERAFPAARRERDVRLQSDEVWLEVKPLLSHALGSTAEDEEMRQLFVDPKPIVIASIGTHGSGKSVSLYGMPRNDSSVIGHDDSGLVDRSVHHLFQLAASLPRTATVTISVSVYILTADADTDTSSGRHAVVDLLASEWHITHSAYVPPSEVWREGTLTFDAAGLEEGIFFRDCATADDALTAIRTARDRWLTAGVKDVGAFVVSMHLTRRDRRRGELALAPRRTAIRFLEPVACLREWCLARVNLLGSGARDDAHASMKQRVQRDLDDLHALLQMRANTRDEEEQTHHQQRIECGRHAGAFGRLLMPALNPGGVLILLTHLSYRGVQSVGSRVAHQILRSFGASVVPNEDAEEDASAQNGVDALSSRVRRPAVAPASLLCACLPYKPFLLSRVHPEVVSSLPSLYAPLTDLVMEYLSGIRNLSVRQKRVQGR